jgi:hypothetical protein
LCHGGIERGGMGDLKIEPLDLLQWIEDSLLEGLQHPSTLAECLNEADCTLRILKKALERNELLLAAFYLTPLDGLRFSDIHAEKVEAERKEAVDRLLGYVTATRHVLAGVAKQLSS